MFKRGDIVMYTPGNVHGMRICQHLEGAIGIVTGHSPETRLGPSYWRCLTRTRIYLAAAGSF